MHAQVADHVDHVSAYLCGETEQMSVSILYIFLLLRAGFDHCVPT